MEPFWHQINEAGLAQGDLLPSCLVPHFTPDFGTGDPEAVQEVPTAEADLIIVTQTCDLVNDKSSLVALCPIHTLAAFEERNAKFKQKGQSGRSERGVATYMTIQLGRRA